MSSSSPISFSRTLMAGSSPLTYGRSQLHCVGVQGGARARVCVKRYMSAGREDCRGIAA
jgi:hypothetical protein